MVSTKSLLALIFALLAVPCLAQTHSNDGLDDASPYTVGGSNWNVCILPACNPGGIGNPTFTQTINNASPSLDGASMKLTISSPTASDGFVYYNAGAQNSDHYLTLDGQFYWDSSATSANAFEWVMFQYTTTMFLHASFQCDHGTGDWRVGNGLPTGFAWVNTGIACSLSNSAWHHLIFRAHWVGGDTSCSGYPALYYDSFTVDGTVHTGIGNQCTAALPGGYSAQTGINLQLDMGSSATTLNEWTDELNFTTYTGPCAGFSGATCPANIPSGVNIFYFFDYASGNDANSGLSESDPWQHLPSCQNATNDSAAHTPGPGEGWILKGGVTVDYHCWPANVPWGGTSSAPDYLGYDPGWYSGGAWTRPILSGGGSGGYNANAGAMVGDSAHHASYPIIDNIEFTGLYFQGTNCANVYTDCNYLATVNTLTSFPDVAWEVKNIYVHNVTHGPCNFVSPQCTGTNDPGNTGAVIHTPRDAASSVHNSYFDNTDGSADCCLATDAAVVYQNYYSGWTNVVFNPSAASQQETAFYWHDNTIRNMETTFFPSSAGTEPHGNCIHVFGTNPSSFNELIYNNDVDCTNANAENLEVEEDSATVYYFNNVNTNMYQPNGYDTSSFSGSGHGGTYYYFQNTEECGVDATPGYICVGLRNSPTVFHYNNFGVSSNSAGGPAILQHSGWTGTFTSSPNNSVTCDSVTTTNFGGSLICAPIGSGNGTGNLNFTQTYPFAPLDATAAATIGSAANLISLCTTISGINAAAGTACLSDTTLGVAMNSANHTVSWPARATVTRPLSGTWENGAYQLACAGPIYPCLNLSTGIFQTPTPPSFTQTSIDTYGYDSSLVTGMPYLQATGYNSISNHTSMSLSAAGSDEEAVVNCKGRSDWSTACGNAPVYFYQATSQGTSYFFAFDPTQPSGSRILNHSTSAVSIVNNGSAGWSRLDPFTYYVVGGSDGLTVQKYVFNSSPPYLQTYTGPTTVFDGATCPGISNSTYQAQPVTWGHAVVLGIGYGTDTLTISGTQTGGSQGGSMSNWVLHYEAASGCEAFNASTGQFWTYCVSACGSQAPSGSIVVPSTYNVYIHEIANSHANDVTQISWDSPCPGTCPAIGGLYIAWNNPTLFSGSPYAYCLASSPENCTGHGTLLAANLVNGNSPNPQIRLFSAMPNGNGNIGSFPGLPTGGTAHFSSLNGSASDVNPILLAHSTATLGTNTQAFNDELLLIRLAGSTPYTEGTVGRIGHSFNAFPNSPATYWSAFQAAESACAIFPDGNYLLCDSAMFGMMGQDVFASATASTTVTTNGTAVTWSSGTKFDNSGIANGFTMVINGTNYTIASVTDATDLVLTSSAGVQSTPVSASVKSAYSALFIVGPLAPGGTSYTLTVTNAGGGTVTDNLLQISCPSTCTGTYSSGTNVSLTATPSGGYTFTSWSGACSGSGACSVTMNSNQAVTATFSPTVAPPSSVTAMPGVVLAPGSIIH